MVNLQDAFLEFHDNIKLDDENETLREKRDILLKVLKDHISDDAASYTTFNQGSYAMGTGIKPDNGDYDIDVGVKFDIDKDDYTDPIEPKRWVRDALDGHTKSVKIRRSCVTVTYQKDDEPIYHVDFAVYANDNADQNMYIAKGKEFSNYDMKYWEESDPEGLINLIRDKYSDADDRKQFRRTIRYMKKWRSHNSYLTGNGEPTGIALTVLAYNLFNCVKTYDFYKDKNVYDDYTAIKNFVDAIKSQFVLDYDSDNSEYYHRISEKLPVAPYNDLFEKMTSKEMQTFYEQISNMQDKLSEVSKATKKTEACEILVKLFGEDFPVLSDRSIVGTSESA